MSKKYQETNLCQQTVPSIIFYHMDTVSSNRGHITKFWVNATAKWYSIVMSNVNLWNKRLVLFCLSVLLSVVQGQHIRARLRRLRDEEIWVTGRVVGRLKDRRSASQSFPSPAGSLSVSGSRAQFNHGIMKIKGEGSTRNDKSGTWPVTYFPKDLCLAGMGNKSPMPHPCFLTCLTWDACEFLDD